MAPSTKGTTASPAAAPAGAGTSPSASRTTPPAKPIPTYGDVYFQPVRNVGESPEEYENRLTDANTQATALAAPKPSTGSFTLLTRPTTKGWSGETKFESEVEALKRGQRALEIEIQKVQELQKNDPQDKAAYEAIITKKRNQIKDLSKDIEILTQVAGDHFISAKQDSTFASSPRAMKGEGLIWAIESAQHILGQEETKRAGAEIRAKQAKREGEYETIKQELINQRMAAKDLLEKGALPQESKTALYAITDLLQKLIDYKPGEEMDLPGDADLKHLLEETDRILRGDAILETESALPKTLNEALIELTAMGKKPTVENLMARGLSSEVAEDGIKLLIAEGVIIQP